MKERIVKENIEQAEQFIQNVLNNDMEDVFDAMMMLKKD